MGGFPAFTLVCAAVLHFQAARSAYIGNTGTAATTVLSSAPAGLNQTKPTRTSLNGITSTGTSPVLGTGPHVGFTSGAPCPTDAKQYPSFIHPAVNPTQSCDIYGPLCQTGSIAVGVNAPNGVTTTTVPCSCYLTAQSLTATKSTWYTDFARSPQCTAFNKVMNVSNPSYDAPIFSTCPEVARSSSLANASVPNLDIDWSLTNKAMPFPDRIDYTCCGSCVAAVSEVRIAYFPAASDAKCLNQKSTKTPSSTNPSVTPAPDSSHVHKRLYPANNGSTTVVDGYTFTSGSIYVEFVSGLSVTDLCGALGKTFRTATIELPPGALSTIEYNIPVGTAVASFSGALSSTTKAVEVRDLACPTWGFSKSWTPPGEPWDPNFLPNTGLIQVASGGNVIEDVAPSDVIIGPPFLPVIMLPLKLLTLDPTGWAKCKGQIDDWAAPILDPPRALMAQAGMAGPLAPPPPPPAPSPINPPSPVAEVSSPAAPTGPPALEDPDGQVHPASPVGIDPALPKTSSTSTSQARDPPVAAANAGPPTPPAATPPANAPVEQSPPLSGEASKLQAALAVSTPQPAPAAPANTPAVASAADSSPVVVAAPPAQPAGASPPSVASEVPAPVTKQQPAAKPQPAANPPAANPPAANPPAQNSPVANAPAANAAPANPPADNNNPPPAPEPPSEPGIGGQILRPFRPATTSQVVVSLVPVAASPAAQPPPGASPAPASDPSNIESPPSSGSSNGSPPPDSSESSPAPGSNSPASGSNNNPASGSNNTPAPSNGNPPSDSTNPNPPSDSSNNNNPPPIASNANSPLQPSPNGKAPSNPSTPSNTNNPPAEQAPAPPVLSFQGSTYAPNSASAYIIASQTLTPGAQVTISNAPPVSLASDGSIAVIGSSTQQLQPQPQPTNENSPQIPPSAAEAPPVINFGGSSYSAGPSSVFIIASNTLTPGGQVTISSTPISLASDGVQAVIGSSTQSLQQPQPEPETTPPSAAAAPSTSSPAQAPNPGGSSLSTPAILFAGSTYQRTSALAYVIASQTLTPGAQVTVSSTPISLAVDGGHVVIGSSTQSLMPSSSFAGVTPTGGEGNGVAATGTAGGSQPFHAGVGRVGVEWFGVLMGGLSGILAVMVVVGG